MKIESRTIATFLFLALVGYLAVTGKLTAEDALTKANQAIQQLPPLAAPEQPEQPATTDAPALTTPSTSDAKP